MEKHCDSIWVIAVNHLYLHRQMKDIVPFITDQYTITLQS
ncbi:unknown [Prevotella sp. CAG:924]|nr:unknown [Prevotella sp. CAG:924]